MVRVKICGITNLSDALAAVKAGADALGFVFARSPRRVSLTEAKKISLAIPPFIARVGVFVNMDPPRIWEIVRECGLCNVQLHGDETPEICGRFGALAIKAVRIRDETSLKGLSRYRVAAFLLDSFVEDKRGGSGVPFSWHIAASARSLKRPIILSGGLTAGNVREAIESVKPYAVDVSSGVESKPGKKDHALLREFIKEAKSAAG